RVHVRLRARAGLEHDERKLLIEAPVDHLLRRPDDEVYLLLGQLPELAVGERAGLLQDAEGPDDPTAPAKALDADRKVVDGALGLRAPEVAGGPPALPQRVVREPHRRLRRLRVRHVTSVIAPSRAGVYRTPVPASEGERAHASCRSVRAKSSPLQSSGCRASFAIA